MQSINGVPLVVGDSLYFYSSGRQKNKIMWDSYTSTGLATLRRDGFVSMHGDKDGYLLTEKVRFDGKHLFINADVKGSLAVEILDEKMCIRDSAGADVNIVIRGAASFGATEPLYVIDGAVSYTHLGETEEREK